MFATTLGEHAFYVLLAAVAIVWFVVKAVSVSDEDGEVKTKASEGIASWIRKWTK